jgi:glycosyltransferase involved in cell wall biosynthesis
MYSNKLTKALDTEVYQNSTVMKSRPLIDVLMPAYNEVSSIRNVVLEYYDEIGRKLPSRFIVAEDGSYDGTKDVLLSLKTEIPISLFCGPVRKGYTKGVGDALKKCRGEWIFFSDSDGQYSPSDFWRLWENRYKYDMVVGRKLHRSEGAYRTVLSNGFHGIANNLFGLNLHDTDCGFRLIRKELVDSILSEVKCLEYSFWSEFTIRTCLRGYKVLEVPISHASRMSGKTQIYKPSKIPMIVLKQIKGLASLFVETRKGQ